MKQLLILNKDGTFNFKNFEITKDSNSYLLDLYNKYGEEFCFLWRAIVEELVRCNNKIPYDQINANRLINIKFALYNNAVFIFEYLIEKKIFYIDNNILSIDNQLILYEN